MIAIYHSGTSLKIQQHVLSSLKDPHGSVRIVIATSALGMGVHFKCLHRAINYDPPNDIESYVQAFGKVGRHGMISEALLLFHSHQLQLCEPEMLDCVKCTTCTREKILAFLVTQKKTAESFQITYVVTFVPEIVSVGRENVKRTQEAWHS